MIPIALHVDYWDYLGWKDAFGSKEHTARQRVYVKKIEGDPYYKKGSIYTPNLVVDGAASSSGTSKPGIQKAIRAALEAEAHIALDVAAKIANGKIQVTVGGKNLTRMSYPDSLKLRVVVVEDGLAVDIKAGELAGKSTTYSNVVRRWAQAIEYKGEADKRREFAAEAGVEKEWNAKRLRVVAFVQDEETMKVWQAVASPVLAR